MQLSKIWSSKTVHCIATSKLTNKLCENAQCDTRQWIYLGLWPSSDLAYKMQLWKIWSSKTVHYTATSKKCVTLHSVTPGNEYILGSDMKSIPCRKSSEIWVGFYVGWPRDTQYGQCMLLPVWPKWPFCHRWHLSHVSYNPSKQIDLQLFITINSMLIAIISNQQ